ncbi:MAG: tetratricopeptide repeat protein, partial [Candidatus Eiseniibacteriota bacterium]
MDGRVPKDRSDIPHRTVGAPGPRASFDAGAYGEHKAQELGDLYFAADNYVVALEYYRRALDAGPKADTPDDRENLLRVGTQIVECLRHRGDLADAVDSLHDLHRRLRPHVTKEQAGRLSASLALLLFERGRYKPAQRAATLAYRLLRDTTLNLDIGRTEMIFGVIALRTGDWNAAREYFESAIATYR